MNTGGQQRAGHKLISNRTLVFPAVMLAIYGILLVFSTDKAVLAMNSSGNVFIGMLIPLSMTFVLMFLINLFLKPAAVAKFLGKSSGIKGLLLSAAAGIISTGPIYAWYPLLQDLKEKGTEDSSIAIFLYNRAVKPFLLPVMVAYFGWLYVITLTVLTLLASIVIGCSMSILQRLCDKDEISAPF